MKKLVLLGLLSPMMLSLTGCGMLSNVFPIDFNPGNDDSIYSASSSTVNSNALYFHYKGAEITSLESGGTVYYDLLKLDIDMENKTGRGIRTLSLDHLMVYVDEVIRVDATFPNTAEINLANNETINMPLYMTAEAYDYSFWSTIEGDGSNLNGVVVAQYTIGWMN